MFWTLYVEAPPLLDSLDYLGHGLLRGFEVEFRLHHAVASLALLAKLLDYDDFAAQFGLVKTILDIGVARCGVPWFF